MHSPPEAKAILIDHLMFDPSGVFELPSDDRGKRFAVSKLLKSLQSDTEYREVLARLNSQGRKEINKLESNGKKIFTFLGIDDQVSIKFENLLKNKTPNIEGSVAYDQNRCDNRRAWLS